MTIERLNELRNNCYLEDNMNCRGCIERDFCDNIINKFVKISGYSISESR